MSDESPAAILYDTNQQEKGVPANPVATAEQSTSSGGFYPSHDDALPTLGYGETHPLFLDGGGNVKVRGPILTDEGGVRDDFPGSSLDTNLTGTATFTTGSVDVVGVGTLFTTELTRENMLRATGDASTFGARVAVVIDDLHAQLESPYLGSTGSAVPIKSIWEQEVGTGASLSVVSSVLQMVSGTTSGEHVFVARPVDFSPLGLNFYGRVSQRVVNQETRLGACDEDDAPVNQAWIIFDGTDNTKCYLRTGSNTGDVETSSTFTLPNGATTATNHWYRVEITPDAVSAYMDGILLGSNKLHIPNMYESMTVLAGIYNTGTASSTTVYIDVINCQNFNIVQVGGGAANQPVAVETGGLDANGDFRIAAVKNTNPAAGDYAQIVRSFLLTALSVSHGSVQTSATGSSYVVLASAAASQVTLINTTGKDLEVRRGGAGVALPVPDGSYWTFRGVANANELGVRRIDQSNVQLTAVYELET